MRPVLQTAHRGRKHRCGACGSAFYDLERKLTACPKCETPYASAHMPRGEPARKRVSWSKSAQRPEPETGPEPSAADASDEDDEGAPLLDRADDAEQAEETEAAEGEDASEAAGHDA